MGAGGSRSLRQRRRLEVNLDSCPECGFDAVSAGRPAACPTCGFPLASGVRVWRTSRTWHMHAARYALLGALAGLVVLLGYRSEFEELPNALLPVSAGLALAGLGLLADRILAGRLSHRYVALTEAGVLVGTRRRRVLVPWNDVYRVKTHGQVPRLERLSDAASIPLDELFDSADELREFQRLAHERRVRPPA